jgi:hypothetical protein
MINATEKSINTDKFCLFDLAILVYYEAHVKNSSDSTHLFLRALFSSSDLSGAEL